MTIEERIEVLFRFHEAHEANLNRLFELQARNEDQLAKNAEQQAKTAEQQAKTEMMLARLLEGMTDHKDAIIGLARIAEAHEHRISDLERPQ